MLPCAVHEHAWTLTSPRLDVAPRTVEDGAVTFCLAPASHAACRHGRARGSAAHRLRHDGRVALRRRVGRRRGHARAGGRQATCLGLLGGTGRRSRHAAAGGRGGRGRRRPKRDRGGSRSARLPCRPCGGRRCQRRLRQRSGTDLRGYAGRDRSAAGPAMRQGGARMGKQEDFVLRALEERDVRFVRLWFTDVLGFLKSVAVAPAELEGAFDEGIGFDGSAIEGFARVYEADMLAKPDPSTFQILPWRGEGPATARMFCDIVMPDGSPSYADPRYVLKRTLSQGRRARASRSTRTPRSSSTCSRTPRRPAASRSRSTAAATSTTPRRARARTSAARRSRCSRRWASRWSSATTRAAPASRRSTCATPTRCRTADNIMTFRTVVREVALSQGIWATLHAQAVHHAPGLGHAHPRVALRGRPQRVLRGRRGVPALQDRPAVHRRHPAPRQPRSAASPTSGSTPTSG